MNNNAKFDDFQKALEELVGDFQKRLRYYNSDEYDETALRNDFLNPLWRALGWDLENKSRKTQMLRDVQLETRVDIAGRKKKADYIFRTDGLNRFVCEAKRPTELGDTAAYQAQRYVFNLGLYLGILSDFQEFKVYVVGGKPDPLAPVDPVLKWNFTEYPLVAQQMWELFSYDAVSKSSLEQYVASLEKKPRKGKAHQGWLVRLPRERMVDFAFLADLEDDRVALARDLVRCNRKFRWTDTALNEAIQRILDRILFIRFCEDREIETGGSLEGIVSDWRNISVHRPPLYPRLVAHFRSLDPEFNGALFSTHFSEKISVSDEFLSVLIEKLSSEDSPYLFNTLPVEILGSVYERFIGRVVHVTGAKHVAVKEKPEVRKAGGIYYTPRYIVDYIVEQTIGNLLKGKTPTKMRELTALDPACGSGSFLIRAFERICEGHLEWFQKNPQSHREELCYSDDQGNLHLTTHLKRQIMLSSIFGVDLDPQAVEVTMLSLYLKILQGETEASVQRQQTLFPDEPLLPDLSKNIRIGNSLIGSDYSDLFDDPEEQKVRPFDYDATFPDILNERRGGFDAVIGNPPYYNVDRLGKRSRQMQYLKRSYAAVWNDKTDILNYFLYKAVTLSRLKVGMIISRAFLEAYKSNRLRDRLRRQTQVEEIVDFADFHVFDAGITTAIVLLRKEPDAKGVFTVRKLRDGKPTAEQLAGGLNSNNEQLFEIIRPKQTQLTSDAWNFSSRAFQRLHDKIDSNHPAIGELFTIGQGMQTGCNGVFGGLFGSDAKKLELGAKWSRKRAANSDIERYGIRDRKEYLLWVEPADRFEDLPRPIRTHLTEHQAVLKKRAAYKRGNCEWWKFTWPLHKAHYDQDKIIAPFLASRNRFALDTTHRFIGLTDTIVLFKKSQVEEDIAYVLALLNSKLLDFRFKGIAKLKGGGIYEYFENSVSKLPIRRIDFSDRKEKTCHDALVQLATRMTDLTAKLPKVSSDAERGSIEDMIRSTDYKIDSLVYKLYGFTDGERKAVEEGIAPIQLEPVEERPDRVKVAPRRRLKPRGVSETQSLLLFG